MFDPNPCPFCGSPDLTAYELDCYVECEECLARGPNARDRDEAVELWNTRTAIDNEMEKIGGLT